MVKVQAIIDFDYKNYDKIKNLESANKKQQNKIYTNDIFDVEDKEALYLTGENKDKVVAVKVLEVMPILRKIRIVEDKEEAKAIIKRAKRKIKKKENKKTEKKK